MKNIYIFKPSEQWRYCGGGLVIVAESFEEAQKLVAENPEPLKTAKLFKKESDIDKEEFMSIWILVETISVNYPESRIILHDENWG